MIDLQSDVLNWVIVECFQILLAGHEQWQRNLKENGLDVWLHQFPCFFELEADSQELQG